ncbi:MAG: enoyl-CoA hydratase/isomerase family protein [Chloroflexota bacterium]|nr:enoyl-CoA hydratase/isomerase family protein [Chloroflexota bacterium]
MLSDLYRPDKLNALNAQLMAELREALDIIELDQEIRVVILTGAGRAFSAGFDLDKDSGGAPSQGEDPDVRCRHLQSHIDTFMMVWNLSKPVIAAVNGFALAGACELVQICDIKIASDRAVLGEPEIRAGVGPPLLITPFSIGLARSKELLLTDDTIDAHEAARLGMVSRVVPHDNLMAECEKIAKKICLLFPVGVNMTKVSVNRALEGMGFLSVISNNLELMIHFDISSEPEKDEFNKISDKQGLKAALDWRDARFKDL